MKIRTTRAEKKMSKRAVFNCNPRTSKIAKNVKAVMSSTVGYCQEIRCLHDRHLPLRIK